MVSRVVKRVLKHGLLMRMTVFVWMAAAATPVGAETVELVTYYPSQANTGDLHVLSLTVGDELRNDTPPNGVAMIFDELGIGLPVGTLDPPSTLAVRGVGTTNASSSLNVQNSNGNSLLFVRDDGNVGIGTNAPRTALDVRQHLNLQDANGAGVIYFRNTRINPAVPVGLFIRSDDDPATYEAASERVFIGANGNVGIGTTAPKPIRLDIRGQMNLEDVNGAAVINFPRTLPPGSALGETGLYIRSDDDPASFEATSERLFIGAAGNVGIGTTNPDASALLQLESTARGFLPPRMTTGQRDGVAGPPEGLVVYNTTLHRLEVRTNTGWEPVGGRRIAVGTYVGNNQSHRNISVGFDPRAVFLTDSSTTRPNNKMWFTTDDYPATASGYHNAVIDGDAPGFQDLTLTTAGFRLRGPGGVNLNQNNIRYFYVAIE